MQIESLKIKNFRTIGTEQTLQLSGGLTLVGPNNAGKTNALMALYIFFTGYDNSHGYNYDTDLSFGDKAVKTSLTCHFRGNPKKEDREIFEKLSKLRSFLNLGDEEIDEFSINVYFNTNSPVYQVYPGAKRPEGKSPQYSMAQKTFIQSVLDSFHCYYIPSKKSIGELYEQFVSPFIRLKVGEALQEYLPKIKGSVSTVAKSMNSVLASNGMGDVKVNFAIPNGSIDNLITGFDLNVGDPGDSSIYSKGMGVQAAVLLSSFRWITEQQNEKKVIWLIEEPETYMHPGLAAKASGILEKLGEISTVIKTTHAINFVPSNIEKIQGVIRSGRNKATSIKKYDSHRDATESIRASLGVKFADYFALSKYNLFVEGETDREYIDYIWGSMFESQQAKYPLLSRKLLLIKDFTGVSDLKGFLKSNLGILKNEVCIVSLFDGDTAGLDAVRELSGYCSNKNYSFNSNKEYVLLPGGLPIEGLWPGEWIMDAFENEPAWFQNRAPIIDADGKPVSFKIRDGSKRAFMEFMLEKFDDDDTYQSVEKFFEMFKTINHALSLQEKEFDDII